MAKFPALPFWTDAYLADCGHLTDAEHGRYIMLLIFLWRAPQHRLPNDDLWLARKFNRSEEQVQTELRPLIKEFCRCDGNWITQKKLSAQFRYVADHTKRMSDMAKSRWQKNKTDAVANAASIAPIPIPIPLTEEKKETKDLRSLSKKAKPRTQIDCERFPDAKGQAEAIDHWLKAGRRDLGVFDQMQGFHDHHKARASTMADWPAAWRTWYRNAPKMNRPQNEPRKSARSRQLDGAARWFQKQEHRGAIDETLPALPPPRVVQRDPRRHGE